MGYITRNFVLPPGATQIVSALIAFTDIHMVVREGVVQRPVTGSPVGRQFVYVSSSGMVEFGVPGAPIAPREPGDWERRTEIVQITFKEI